MKIKDESCYKKSSFKAHGAAIGCKCVFLWISWLLSHLVSTPGTAVCFFQLQRLLLDAIECDSTIKPACEHFSNEFSLVSVHCSD